MKTRAVALLLAVVFAVVLAACRAGAGDHSPGTSASPTPEEDPAVVEARQSFPRFADLQTKVLSSTCSPNPGVCHNSSNYPSLQSAGNTLAAIGAPCNTEIPNPLAGWDGCELPGDVLVAGTSGDAFRSTIAWIEQQAPGSWSVHLVDPAGATLHAPVSFENADGSVVYDPPVLAATEYDTAFSVTVDLADASRDALVTVNTDEAGRREFADSILATVVGGDPNRNGVFGAANAASSGAIVFPGSLSRSYLWRRITGTVAGSRMPLANGPLTLPDYVGIACWIEGLSDAEASPDDPIDYDHCPFAAAPTDYTAP